MCFSFIREVKLCSEFLFQFFVAQFPKMLSQGRELLVPAASAAELMLNFDFFKEFSLNNRSLLVCGNYFMESYFSAN